MDSYSVLYVGICGVLWTPATKYKLHFSLSLPIYSDYLAGVSDLDTMAVSMLLSSDMGNFHRVFIAGHRSYNFINSKKMARISPF